MPRLQYSDDIEEIMARIPGWIVRWGIVVIFILFMILSVSYTHLSEAETQLLFDEGIAARKPLVQNLMNLDLKSAYDFAAAQAVEKTASTPEFLKILSALILKSTGGAMSAMAGTFDTSKGDYRLCSVQAGPVGKSYMNYQKVPDSVTALCTVLQERIDKPMSQEEIYNLSFDAHLNLVTIHPWADGNGRAARLLMNYVQFYRGPVSYTHLDVYKRQVQTLCRF